MVLSPEQIKLFKEQLMEESRDLEERLKHLSEDEWKDFGDDIDSNEEESDEVEEFANQMGVKEVLERRLKRIKNAIIRIDEGRFGKCEDCGKEIEEKILSVDPESNLCKECKKKESK